jgi:hypothetical protein
LLLLLLLLPNAQCSWLQNHSLNILRLLPVMLLHLHTFNIVSPHAAVAAAVVCLPVTRQSELRLPHTHNSLPGTQLSSTFLHAAASAAAAAIALPTCIAS